MYMMERYNEVFNQLWYVCLGLPAKTMGTDHHFMGVELIVFSVKVEVELGYN